MRRKEDYRSIQEDGDRQSFLYREPRTSSTSSLCTILVSLAGLFVALTALLQILASIVTSRSSADKTSASSSSASWQNYDEQGRFILQNYDQAPPLTNFLPSLVGIYGKPAWALYVNRGQGIAAFGTESKDFPFLEYKAAPLAWQNTPFLGFRTFLQFRKDKDPSSFTLYEPFRVREPSSSIITRNMYMGTNEVQFQEIMDQQHRLETNVTFFVLPEEDFAAFVKRTTITNLHPTQTTEFALLDGMAKLEPGSSENVPLFRLLKGIPNTLQAWMTVRSPYNDTLQMPFFLLSGSPLDTAASVMTTEAGHFVLSVLEHSDDEPYPQLAPILYDPYQVFGTDTTYLYPTQLYHTSIQDILESHPQHGEAKTSCAMGALPSVRLKPGESLILTTYFGKSNNIWEVPLHARLLLNNPGYSEYKHHRSRELVQQITSYAQTQTAHALFNRHVEQMFLDNCLRGGVPHILGEVDDDAHLRNQDEDGRLKVYHLFSRVHGDLERDYNDFIIEPTFFSQGPGNFRDVIQNRRTDVIFNPRIGSYNILYFLSLIQADGYNPLKVESPVFHIDDTTVCSEVAQQAVGVADGHRAQREALSSILMQGPFRPGQLFLLIEQQNIELVISRQEFIDLVISKSVWSPLANYTTGFWSDHFTYVMDHIESFVSIYPDWEQRILYEEKVPFFFSEATVKPRDKKYVRSLVIDGNGYHVRQLDAVEIDTEKLEWKDSLRDNNTGWYQITANFQHTADGKRFFVSPIAKLLNLAIVKFATRDCYGMGIEMEADRPGWNDANNGLPGMLGSGMPETYELLRLLRYIRSVVIRFDKDFMLPLESAELMDDITTALYEFRQQTPSEEHVDVSLNVPGHFFTYWDQVTTAREMYRAKTRITFQGKLRTIPAFQLAEVLEIWVEELEKGIERATKLGVSRIRFNPSDGKSLSVPTYFAFDVVHWEATGESNDIGHSFVRATSMKVKLLPLFLEGPTRMMNTIHTTQARNLYKEVKKSELRDDALSMYTICGDIQGAPLDMGRQRDFPAGWLENQSVWLHMSYKFYLSLLKQEMYDEFFDEMTMGGMLPFMNVTDYGRSLTECVSFIVSSAFKDSRLHGRGFLPRLSGSTSEFLLMWASMFIGPQPFFLDNDGLLNFQLVPALPAWMFSDNNDGTRIVSFQLFGSIHVTYHASSGSTENLFRVKPHHYRVGLRDGSVHDIHASCIEDVQLVEKIRRMFFVSSIDVYF